MDEAGPDLNPTPISHEALAAVTVGELRPTNAPIELVPYDPAWPRTFAREPTDIGGGSGP